MLFLSYLIVSIPDLCNLTYFVLLYFHARMFVDALWSPAIERADLLALVCDVYL